MWGPSIVKISSLEYEKIGFHYSVANVIPLCSTFQCSILEMENCCLLSQAIHSIQPCFAFTLSGDLPQCLTFVLASTLYKIFYDPGIPILEIQSRWQDMVASKVIWFGFFLFVHSRDKKKITIPVQEKRMNKYSYLL